MDQDITHLFPRTPWPHQLRGVTGVLERFRYYTEPICLTSPTGTGKSAMQIALARWGVEQGLPVLMLTNRRLLLEQTMKVFDEAKIPYGVRAASFPELEREHEMVQLSSIQTEIARSIRRQRKPLHPAQLVLVDEAHLMKSGESEGLIRRYAEMGAKVVGVTATPLNLNHLYRHLVVACNTAEGRSCGALVKAIVYAPDEMDLSRIKPTKTGEYSVGDIRKEVWTHAIIARVHDKWKEYNPDARPAFLYAPGVAESVGFAEHFHAMGVRAAHIDGEDVWLDGKLYKSERAVRNAVFEEWRNGEIKIICNRFVCREGLDFPSCYHLILATPIGSLCSYLQTVGRALRKSPETPDFVVIQDHGGSYWRHGSPNENRDWMAMFEVPEREVIAQRLEKMRDKSPDAPEPINCPQCGLARSKGLTCPGCGFTIDIQKKSRLVWQKSGELKCVTTDRLPARREKLTTDTQDRWDRMFWASRKSKSPRSMNFNQLLASFFREHGYYPPKDLANMPATPDGWRVKVSEIPYQELRRRSDDPRGEASV